MRTERIRLAALVALLVVAALGTALRLASPWRAFYWNDEIWTSVQSTGHTLDGVVRFTESPRAMHVADFTAMQEFDPSEKFGTFLRSDPHTSPLFYSLCWAAIRAAGDHVVGTRLLAAILGVLALWGVFLAARELFQRSMPAQFAVAIAAISPVQLYLAYDARPYGLWFAATCFSTFAFLRAHRSGEVGWWAWYAVATTVMLYSHLYGMCAILAQLAFAAVSPATSRGGWKRFGLALLAVGTACLPWILFIYHHGRAVKDLTAWLGRPIPFAEALNAFRSAALWQFATFASLPYWRITQDLVIVATIGVVVVSLVDLWRHEARETAVLVTVLCFALPTCLWATDFLVGGRRFSVTRYYVATWFGFTLSIGPFAARQLDLLIAAGSRRWRAVAGASIALIAGLFASAAAGAFTMFRARQPEGKPDAFVLPIAEAITSAQRPVIVNPGLVTMPLLLSNAIPVGTTLLNVREQSTNLGELWDLARDHELFFLRPCDLSYFEPRRIEAGRIEHALAEGFELVESPRFLVRLRPRDDFRSPRAGLSNAHGRERQRAEVHVIP